MSETQSPEPEEKDVAPEIKHIDIALSGGGFRATLFHLGVMGFLRDHGLLGKVRNICSVSGGSILAAHMVTRWPEYRDSQEGFVEAAEHLIKAIQNDDLSGRALRPWHSKRRALTLHALKAELLATEYRRILGPTKPTVLGNARKYPVTWEQIPRDKRPCMHLLATHLNSASMCVFSSDHETGFKILDDTRDPNPDSDENTDDKKQSNAPNSSVKPKAKRKSDRTGLRQLEDRIRGENIAWGLAASSAFPPIFGPLTTSQKDPLGRLHLLTDGGVYDNSGVNYLTMLYKKKLKGWTENKDRLVIISDAGRSFAFKQGEPFDTILGLAARVSDAQGDRIAEFDTDRATTFFGEHDVPVLRCSIHEQLDVNEIPSNHSTLVQHSLREIRTELDKFSDAEVFLLYRHGYLVASQQYAEWRHNKGLEWTPPDAAKVWWPCEQDASWEELLDKLEDSHKVKKVSWLRKRLLQLVAAIFAIVGIVGFLLGQILPPLIPSFGSASGCEPTFQTLTLRLRQVDQVKQWPLAYGSGLVYHQKVNGKHEFYLITDRGPAFDGPHTADGKELKLYLVSDFQPHIAKVVWDPNAPEPPIVDQSFPLNMFEGMKVNGLPPKRSPPQELAGVFEQHKLASTHQFTNPPQDDFGIDPEDLALSPEFEHDNTIWIVEEYRPALLKAVLKSKEGVIDIVKVLEPGKGLPEELGQPRPNRGLESISIKDDFIFVALQGEKAATDDFIWIARAELDAVARFANGASTSPPHWDKFKYKIPDYYSAAPGRGECAIGGLQAIDKNHLLVLEREAGEFGRRHLITAVELTQPDGMVIPMEVIDLGKFGWRAEKPEGITRIDDYTIAISSDNDFGMRLGGQVLLGTEKDNVTATLPTRDAFLTIQGKENEPYLIKWKLPGYDTHPFVLQPSPQNQPIEFWIMHLKSPLSCLFTKRPGS